MILGRIKMNCTDTKLCYFSLKYGKILIVNIDTVVFKLFY